MRVRLVRADDDDDDAGDADAADDDDDAGDADDADAEDAVDLRFLFSQQKKNGGKMNVIATRFLSRVVGSLGCRSLRSR